MMPLQPAIHVRADRRRAPLFGALLALAVVAGAAWFGYHRHRMPAAGPDPVATVAVAASRPAAAASEAASGAPIGLSIAPAARVRRSGAAGTEAGLAWPLWEFQLRQPIPPRDPPLTPPSWRLIGATSAGGNRSLIIQRQGRNEPEYFRTGDTLPGGYVVGEITDEDVTLIHGKRSVLLSYIGTR